MGGMNVSFDFDGTLTKRSVQDFARHCKVQGLNVWIVTSRHKLGISNRYNSDLLKVCQELNIPESNVIFTCGVMKKDYFRQFPDFAFHLDDCWIELHEIETYTDVKAIPVFGNSDWEQDCWNSIQEYKSKIETILNFK